MIDPRLHRALRDEIARIPVVDCHEHLPPEAERVAGHVDFFTLFSHYCVGDLVAAGAGPDVLARLESPETPVVEKWSPTARTPGARTWPCAGSTRWTRPPRPTTPRP